jgi:hypothetical protein
MAKAKDIPTTAFVPPYKAGMPAEMLDKWLVAVASYIGGSQTVKDTGDFQCTRTGALVFIQGSITVVEDTSTTDMLPILPRTDGFLTASKADGTLVGLTYSAGSSIVSLAGCTAGKYFISGSYIAKSVQELT